MLNPSFSFLFPHFLTPHVSRYEHWTVCVSDHAAWTSPDLPFTECRTLVYNAFFPLKFQGCCLTIFVDIICLTHFCWNWMKQCVKWPPTLTELYRCPRRNGQNFGRVFLMLNYTDITQNTNIQSWTVTEIMAIEKCGLLGCPRSVRRPWRHTHPLRMPGNQTPLANIAMQWPWRDNEQLRPV